MELPCVDIEILAALISGKISREDRERVFAHIQTCNDCFERVNSALLVATDAELETWQPLSDKQAKCVMKKIRKNNRKPLFSRKMMMKKLTKWRDDMSPEWPLAYGYARNSPDVQRKPHVEYIHIETEFSNVKTVLLFEKYHDRFNIYIRAADNSDMKNIRFNMNGKGGQVSRLIKEGHTSFEDFPFGTYQLKAIHKQTEKGTYTFEVSGKGLSNGENTLS